MQSISLLVIDSLRKQPFLLAARSKENGCFRRLGYRTPIACVAGTLSNKGSLGPGSALGEKEKKSVSEASREVIWGGERAPPHQPRPQGFSLSLFPLFFKGKALGTRLPPHTTSRFASLADIFPKWTGFLPFYTTAEPGPRLK